jgi:hypothetical protein
MFYRQEEGGESSAVFRRAKLNLVDLAGSEKVSTKAIPLLLTIYCSCCHY